MKIRCSGPTSHGINIRALQEFVELLGIFFVARIPPDFALPCVIVRELNHIACSSARIAFSQFGQDRVTLGR
jgi:hypothetical protein